MDGKAYGLAATGGKLYVSCDTGTIYAFAAGSGQTISPATNPNPFNNATGVLVDVQLSWTGGDGALSYNVFFGASWSEVANANNPDIPPGRGSQTSTIYNPGTLDYLTTYYWRIDSVNGVSEPGTVWSFTTVYPR